MTWKKYKREKKVLILKRQKIGYSEALKTQVRI